MLLEGRRDEQSEYQAKDIESNEQTEETTHQLDARPTQTCRNCGGTFPHEGGYPAKGKVCHKCGKENHFVKMCRGKFQQPRSTFGKSKQHGKPRNKDLNMLIQEENSDSDEGYLYTMASGNKRNAKVKVSVGGNSFQMTVDTGATNKRCQIAKYKHESICVQHSGNLLSLSTAQDLGLISLQLNKISVNDTGVDEILARHAKVFEGLGKLKGETVKLDIDKGQVPKAQQQRRIPYHIREKVKDAVKQLEKEDVIERVPEDQATPSYLC